ncbi:hypothetical protein H920_16388 [Fukomys damarensis]|uniref:Uncharacterized protein n=1 Tax=Fukomys damarensis TaxID=885580 RepID=A0A091CSD3_FUKDA|nr:hypothetical protein H920_16388 [Fukomys damarensis]
MWPQGCDLQDTLGRGPSGSPDASSLGAKPGSGTQDPEPGSFLHRRVRRSAFLSQPPPRSLAAPPAVQVNMIGLSWNWELSRSKRSLKQTREEGLAANINAGPESQGVLRSEHSAADASAGTREAEGSGEET